MSTFIKLSKEKLSIGDVYSQVQSPACGGISVFLGTTRDNFEGKSVVRLEYEAYEEMAVKELHTICENLRAKWSVDKIAVIHRLGEVPIGEIGVAIAISSTHRSNAINAVEFAIDNLKKYVPVWKKEFYSDGSYVWKENCEAQKITEFT
ncbi:Molybdopterin synthase catalytic subunit [Oopsacas minuta]|uniref:Molybdopterin synthase catalytic subunit n=1 Tax=Oopsacas minuta TaxID=111878 RepID=A0AAV7JSQ4_9METZ|nr:Molybdopterin synthase catalytic subunit [Oopsacas minuta]